MGIFIYINETEKSLVQGILQKGGYDDFIFCSNPKELEEKLQLNDHISTDTLLPDLFIIDLSIDRDAIKICSDLKEHILYKDIPFIALSDSSTQETFQMAFAFGAADFIVKPIRSYEFLSRIRSSLKMKHEIDRRKSRERELLEVTRQLTDLNTVLNRLSLIDSLTGVPNRRCFDQSLNQELHICKRQKSSLSLLLLDVDYFKFYNDTYGHQEGDECLTSVARSISSCLRRPTDLTARYGGEEFAIILPGTDLEGAKFVAEKIRHAIKISAIPHSSSEVSDLLTVSIGVVTRSPENDSDSQTLIAAADAALYKAKENGRNCIVVASDLISNDKPSDDGKAS